LANRFTGAEMHYPVKFNQNRSGCGDITSLRYFTISAVRPRFLKFLKFIGRLGPEGLPNFVKIGQTVFEISQLAKFSQNWSSGFWDIAILYFSRWWPPPRWIIEISIFWPTGSGGWRYITIPRFVTISQTVFEISQFFNFSRWRPSAILDLFRVYTDHIHRLLGDLYHYAKFGCDYAVVSIMWKFQYLARLT